MYQNIIVSNSDKSILMQLDLVDIVVFGNFISLKLNGRFCHEYN